VRMFQGIPSVECALGGRLWATWYGGGTGEGPENYVMLNTSGDGGHTWSELKLVVDPPHRASEPALWHDPQGKLWLLWNEYPNGLRGADSRMWAITTEQSDTADPAWSEPRLLARELNNFNKPTVLDDGRWLWPTGSWNFGNLSRPLLSSDHGRTFTPGGTIPIAREARNFEEYQVVERRDRTLWLLTRTSYGIGECFSSDGGATWSEVAPSPELKHTVSRFFVSRLASGNLLLVKNGPIDGDVGRSKMTAFLSGDDGATWSGGLMLDERAGVSYPDGVQGAEGTIYVIYDRQRHTDKEILMAAFAEEDVAAGKAVSDRARLKLLVNKATGLNPKHEVPAAHDFLTGNQPDVEPVDGTIKKVEPGAVLFSDRPYAWHQIPKQLEGRRYVQMSIEGGEVRVRRAGMCYVATPLPRRNADNALAILLKQGFVRTRLTEFALFKYAPRPQATLCSVFQKQVEAGETIRLSKWGILVY